MIQLSDIHPLTDFLRNHKEHIKRLKKAGRPEVLTINGKAELVVHDAHSYQYVLEAVEYLEAVRGIRRGLRSFAAGKGIPLEKADERIRRKHDIPH